MNPFSGFPTKVRIILAHCSIPWIFIYKAALALFPCGQKATFMTSARRETQSLKMS